MTWRPAEPDEIHTYYQTQFREFAKYLPEFLVEGLPKEYGIELDPPHPVSDENASERSFVRRDTYETNTDGEPTKQRITPFGSPDERGVDPVDFIQNPAKNDPAQSNYSLIDPDSQTNLNNPVAKSVYVSLDNWNRYRITAVDIDAKDIALDRTSVTDPTTHEDETTEQAKLREAGIINESPEGYPYNFNDIDRAIQMAFDIKEVFKRDYNADQTLVVYSGQGAHVYLLDSDPYHRYDEPARRVIAADLQKNRGFTIDEAVTIQENRLLRLPYTLHTGVGRVVTPIDDPDYDYFERSKPGYLL